MPTHKPKIAIAHYHLRVGGVSTVIRNQVEAVRGACDVLVLTGEPPQGSFPCDTAYIDGLGYDTAGTQGRNPKAAAEAILGAIRSKWSRGCDLLHIHNPTLAKNKCLLEILSLLQEKGVRLFLQVHDFAEDGRPDAFTPHPYPADSHWAVLNSRDHQALIDAGLKSEGLHLIPNAVTPIPKPEKPVLRQRFALYPVRALRRKNIGEAILLFLFFKDTRSLRISLPPSSPKDRRSHAFWKRFVAAGDLKVGFDTGLTEDLVLQAAAADFFVTTSITEGFGFSFLEPWTAGKPLSGRRIPEICADFEKNGISFDELYDHIQIPLAWIDSERFFARWRSGVLNAATAFAYPVDETDLDAAFLEITGNGNVDFGLLDEGFQEEVLLRVLSAPKEAGRLIETNPFLTTFSSLDFKESRIDSNREAVITHYGMTAYRKRLLDAYAEVTTKQVRHRIRKEILLKRYFDLKRFSLLKWSEDPR